MAQYFNTSRVPIVLGILQSVFSAASADILPGRRPTERAAVFLSAISGFQDMRQIIGISGLTEADPSDLSDQLQSLFKLLIGVDAD